MYENLAVSSSHPDVDRSDLEKILHKLATQPFGLIERFLGNIRSLQKISGPWYVVLFIITSLTPLLVRRRGAPWQRRLMLSAWVWFYILAVSSITDLIPRYIVVILPFLVLHIAMEICALASMLSIIRVPGCRIVLCAALMMPPASALAVTTAFDRFEVAYSAADPALYAPLREFIQEGDVVFSPAPLDAYLLGAGFRVLPDDSLDRVATYAERTGVKWLVVARKWHNRRQLEFYNHQWYIELAFPTPDGPRLVKCCEADGGRIILYEFQSDSARGRAAAGATQGVFVEDALE
jgi:hypothetical protein